MNVLAKFEQGITYNIRKPKKLKYDGYQINNYFNIFNNMTDIEKDELRRDTNRLFACAKLSDTKDMLNILSECLFQVVYFQRNYPVDNRPDADAKIIPQMILSKILNLNKLLNGVNFDSIDKKKLSNIVDPTVIAVPVRNLCETVATFNLIYTKKGDNKLILYNLWAIAGLKFRQRFASKARSADSKRKQMDELLDIEKLTKEIEQTSVYKSLSANGLEIIKRKLKEKDYKIQFVNNNDIRSLSWQETILLMGIKEDLMDDMYTYFSLYSHPSNVSVFQFADLFRSQSSHSVTMSQFNILNVIKFVSCFIDDYIKLFPNTIKAFESIPLVYQIVINFHNQFLRGSGSGINDTLLLLN